jgi:hypothetical protein
MHHIYASVSNPILPQELKVHQETASEIGAIGAEHQAISIETQAQESIRAIEKRDEEMRAAQKHRDSIAGMFGRKALEATKGVAKSAHAFANYMTTPEEFEYDTPGLFGIMKDVGGDISSMGSALIEEPQAVREHRERAMPYTAALEAARYEVPLQDDSERRDTPRPRPPREGGSSSSSSAAAASAAAAAPSHGAVRERRGDPLADVAQGMKGVVRAMRAGGVLGRGIVGNEAGY